MKIPNWLRAAKRRAVAALKTSRERIVLRGIAPAVLSYPPQRQTESDANGKPPTYLITRYAYHAKDASMGESIEKFTLDNTLIAAGLGRVENYLWEIDWRPFPRGDWALLEKCRAVKPKAIILSSYDPGYPLQPAVETIRLLRSVWKIPIIAMWWDTCYAGFWPSIVPVLPYVDVHVVLDNPLLNFFDDAARRQFGHRFLALWEAMDTGIYNNPGFARDVEVAFLGQVAGYRSVRMPYVRHLLDNNVPLFCSLVNRAEQPSHSDYQDVLKRTKIGLNFSQSVDSDQLKSRVFETMSCGALLMENDNPQTRCYFTPMKDYVPFDSPSDLLDKIRYFLEHEDERIEIAARGEEKVRSEFDAAHFWKAVTDKLDAVKHLPL
jgi:hypothetical protein